ncbi:MerR family transcriptional regulator [Microbacterium sp. NPDC077184]|uniref:MerR family transcriptional regulator n=1 Tax=Microbacterium sp. NPDC077184 TaxID=3154764 RepID=UPI00343B23E0
MRISELSLASGIPVASIKFYIREGMLPRGASTSATSADYGDDHLARLRLIQALSEVRALPLARVKEILDLVDHPAETLYATLGRAVNALPPYVEPADADIARETIEALGLTWDPGFGAVAQLGAAIRAVQGTGLRWDAELAALYLEPIRTLATGEIAPLADMAPADAVAHAVLGTALYEPVILALRRLAHQQILADQVTKPRA